MQGYPMEHFDEISASCAAEDSSHLGRYTMLTSK
jgi:hypothetical protein